MADRWRADGGPLLVVFGSSLVSTLVNLKEKSNLGPLLPPPPPPPPPPPRLSGSAHKIKKNSVFRHFVNFSFRITGKRLYMMINNELWHTPTAISFKYIEDLQTWKA